MRQRPAPGRVVLWLAATGCLALVFALDGFARWVALVAYVVLQGLSVFLPNRA